VKPTQGKPPFSTINLKRKSELGHKPRKYGFATRSSLPEPNSEAVATLMTIIKLLKPLTSQERHRAIRAAMMFLGETWAAPTPQPHVEGIGAPKDPRRRSSLNARMKRIGVSTVELDRVFSFSGDGSFDIHDVPGKSKRDKSVNTYILTGVGTFLSSGKRRFDDATARGFCAKLRCYDKTHHSTYLKQNVPEFNGDKKSGYLLTNVGLRRGAVLVKELSRAATGT
jgi:hypothetical protein